MMKKLKVNPKILKLMEIFDEFENVKNMLIKRFEQKIQHYVC